MERNFFPLKYFNEIIMKLSRSHGVKHKKNWICTVNTLSFPEWKQEYTGACCYIPLISSYIHNSFKHVRWIVLLKELTIESRGGGGGGFHKLSNNPNNGV